MSDVPTGLLPAILAVQGEVGTLPKDKLNPAFRGSKYTPLDTVVETVGPILNKYGLVWMTKPVTNEQGNPALHYVLAHAASGEREEGVMPLLLTKQDPQGQGSALTYARRYSLCAVLNLVADEDDDGNTASTPSSRGQAKAPVKPSAPVPDGALSEADRNELQKLYKDLGEDRFAELLGVKPDGIGSAVAALNQDTLAELRMRAAKVTA